MVKKTRIQIPKEIAAEILFLSDRTCCVCTTRGKPLQIHHIDENPANNNLNNLSVLCLECHNQTLTNGGFGRSLDANQIIKFRNEWHDRVRNRKAKADEIASIQAVTGSTASVISNALSDEDYLDYKTYDDPDLLKDYLDKIVIVHKAQLIIAQAKWDSGITAKMNDGNYDMIDFYEEVLVEISTFYPKGHFNNLPPEKYFNEMISSKFLWHRPILEPLGRGTGGTIISTIASGNVMNDLKHMVVNMANSLLLPYILDGQVDFEKWRNEWLGQ